MKVAFLTYGTSPVPATKGGAVENLIEDLLDQNEVEQRLDFTVFSIYEKAALEKSKNYKHTKFEFVKCLGIVDVFDRGIYWIAKSILRKVNLISYRFILRRLFVMAHYPKLLLKNDYDRVVLVTNSTLFFVLKNKKVARKYKDKVVYYLHNEVRSFFKCEKEVASIRSLIGISKFVNEAFLKKVPTVNPNACYVLKNCIDTENFIARDELKISFYKNEFGIKDTDFVVVFAGRIVAEKGALETLEAIKKCNDKNIKLLIVGGGFYSSDVVDNYSLKLREIAESIKEQIIFTGYIDYDDMPSVYKVGDIAVLPSMWDEPAGMTMVEACISGLPLITTNSGGIPEYIPEEAAVILERNDELIDEIFKWIKNFKDNLDLRQSYVSSGVNLAYKLNLKNFYREFYKIISK